jgi:hypothetical protein
VVVPRPEVVVVGRRCLGHALGHARPVLDVLLLLLLVIGLGLVVVLVLGHHGKANRRREDAPPPLPRLHRPRRKRPPVAHALDVEQDRRRRVSGQQEVAVARVREEVIGHRALARRQALRDDGAAVDAPRAWRVPRLARVGEDVLQVIETMSEMDRGS